MRHHLCDNAVQRLSILLLGAALATSAHAQDDDASVVAFDSFTYTGVDPTAEGAAAGAYHNPILAGFYPDPSICRAGDDYYIVNSSFAYFPGIPISHSTDLVNWAPLGHVIHRPEQLSYQGRGVSDGIYAPAITYHDGTFYVICTMVGGEGNFVVTAQDPAGPWSDATRLGFDGIDPALFFDDNGRAWVVNNGGPEGRSIYNGHRAIWIQEFDAKEMKMIGPRKVIVDGGVDITQEPSWIEAPHIYQRDGWYYLACAEGGTGANHSEVVFRSKQADGPYEPWDQNPILTQRDLSPDAPGAVTCAGHADMVIGPDGEWWAVFLGVRPYEGRYSPMGRETFLLPVTWTADGWPRILPEGERLPLNPPAPAGAEVAANPAIPFNGSFTWKDDFDRQSLSPAWIMLRTPTDKWWEIDSGQGVLKLTAREEQVSGRGNPSYLARRVQHATFEASLVVEPPSEPGVVAGLAAFQNERSNYLLTVRRDGDGLLVELQQPAPRGRGRGPGGGFRGRGAAPTPTESAKSAKLPLTDKLELIVRADNAKCSFSYRAADGQEHALLADADARALTTEAAGGFVGATVGPYAYRVAE